MTQNLKKQYRHCSQNELNQAFIKACQDGALDIVQYLLTSPELVKHADIHTEENDGFRWACHNGHFEIVKYLLTSPELHDHADIHADDDDGFHWAVLNGYLEIVKYLLTSPELTDHANIHAKNDLALRWAYEENHLDIVHYLLSLSKEHYIDFEKKACNLQWAINHKQTDIIYQMIVSLYRNDIILFNEKISMVMDYFIMYSFEHYIQICQEYGVQKKTDIVYEEIRLFINP